MPVKTSKNPLAAKIAGAHEKHKETPVQYQGGGSDLPAGIEAGVAELVDAKIGVYAKGDYTGESFFYAAAVVKQPTEFAGRNLEGLRTTIGPMPICQTTNAKGEVTSIDENWDKVLNELKKLVGVDTIKGQTADETLAMIPELPNMGLHTRFRTWGGGIDKILPENGKWTIHHFDDGATTGKPTKKYWPTEAAAIAANPYANKQGRINHDWRGACAFNGQVSDGVVDNTPDGVPDASTEAAPATEDVDLDALLAAANKKDTDAQTKLKELAVAAGHSEEAVDAADDWEAVVGLIKGGQSLAEAPTAEVEPQVEQVFNYAGGKKGELVEIEIVSVSEKNKTVKAKFLADGKAVLGKDKKPLAIPFAELKEIE